MPLSVEVIVSVVEAEGVGTELEDELEDGDGMAGSDTGVGVCSADELAVDRLIAPLSVEVVESVVVDERIDVAGDEDELEVCDKGNDSDVEIVVCASEELGNVVKVKLSTDEKLVEGGKGVVVVSMVLEDADIVDGDPVVSGNRVLSGETVEVKICGVIAVVTGTLELLNGGVGGLLGMGALVSCLACNKGTVLLTAMVCVSHFASPYK